MCFNLKCPNCNVTLPTKPEKEWNYQQYMVKMSRCSKCGKTIKAYYKEGKLSHTIPKQETT